MGTESENNNSQVIARAAVILRALENQPNGLSISALARATALPRTTVHRLVASLEAEQLLINSKNGVQLGPALARLSLSAHTDIISLSKPPMETLGRKTRETVDLSVYRGSYAVLVGQFVSDQELRVASAVGTAFPCHCTAHGKAMLALLPDEQIAEIFSQTSEKRTPGTLDSLAALLADIKHIRHQGFAVDKEEHAAGVCGIGVSIRASLSEHYAISVAVPTVRFNEKFDLLLSSLMQCRTEIEAMLAP